MDKLSTNWLAGFLNHQQQLSRFQPMILIGLCFIHLFSWLLLKMVLGEDVFSEVGIFLHFSGSWAMQLFF